jgi:hypothetical protein
MKLVPPGPTQITFRGRLIHRDHGFVDVKDITCPDGHRVRLGAVKILADAGLTCTHAITGGVGIQRGGECGALMWLLYLPSAGHLKRFYVSDMEYRELEFWERQGYGAEEVLRYIGAWFTRGDAGALRRQTEEARNGIR